MKFVELKNSLKKEIKNNYLITGNDDFLLNRSCELIFDATKIQMEELNYIKYNFDVVDFDEIIKNLNTMPVFDDKKLIVVKIDEKTNIQNLKELDGYLKDFNNSSILVIVAKNRDKDFKKYEKEMQLVNCFDVSEKVIDSFVLFELRKYGINITADALKLLNSYCVYDLSKITKELEKLINFVYDKKIIEQQDVKLLVNKTLEFEIYELTESLAKKQKEKVFELSNQLKAKKDTIKLIIPLIYSHFRRLFYVAISKNNRAELSEFLGVKEYAITVAINQSKFFSKKNLKKIIDICEELDYEIKQSIISIDLAIDYLLLKILNV